jgi:hypothetical protein
MRLSDYPILIAPISFLVLGAAVWFGASLRARRGRKELTGEARDDFDVVVAASLTLLGLIIGFSFSMSTSRYDQRKDFEEAEANAIGTEYVRADVLPAAEAQATKELLRKYLDQRILFYTTRDRRELAQISAQSAQLQKQLWSTVEAVAVAQPNVVFGLAMSGMNDVLNSHGGSLAQPHSSISLVFDESDRLAVLRDVGISLRQVAHSKPHAMDPAVPHLHVVLSDLRYR